MGSFLCYSYIWLLKAFHWQIENYLFIYNVRFQISEKMPIQRVDMDMNMDKNMTILRTLLSRNRPAAVKGVIKRIERHLRAITTRITPSAKAICNIFTMTCILQ